MKLWNKQDMHCYPCWKEVNKKIVVNFLTIFPDTNINTIGSAGAIGG